LGELDVVIPETGNVVVNASVDLGDLQLPDGASEGFGLKRTWSRTGQDGPTLTLDLEVGLGELRVHP
ncbi:MAG: hypothetical protein Q4G43_15800, partial [Mobilicoccus sp.]|nr:hypothetical protein [Mobilicoccus sp.]